MFLIEVIPLTRGSSVGSLTYFSSNSYIPGTVVNVPIRSKEARGLVVESKPVSAAKAAVRAATFSLRKLPEQASVSTLPPVLLEVAKKLSLQMPATMGAILYSLLPPEVREGQVNLESDLPCHGEYFPPDISVMTATTSERLDFYRGLVREAFAHRGSILLVVPTSAHIERVSTLLSSGISDRVVVFSPALSPKKLARAYTSLHDLSSSKLIITTPAHAFVDRHDITNIVIDHARSPFYRSRVRPYVDLRSALLTMAKVTNRQLLLGDILLRPEDEWMRRNDLYQSVGEHQHRVMFNNRLRIIKQKDKPSASDPFRLFSTELDTAINKVLSAKGSVFLYAARRGLAPVVACGDCGHILRCPDSGAPYSLFRTIKNGEEERWLLSPVSGRRVRASDTCEKCGSWRLRERGIGIQQIYDELCARFPKEKVILFDHTTATTARAAAMLMAKFYDEKGSILLGTSMAIPYLEKPVDVSALVSLDAARSIPTWRADEEIFSLLLTLRELTMDTVFVQTRSEPDSIIEFAKQGQIDRFYDEELSLRSSLSYPPFSVFVHLTISGNSAAVAPLETSLAESLARWSPQFYSAPDSVQSKTTRYCLVRIPQENWPEQALLETLRSLPPSVRIEINPARIV